VVSRDTRIGIRAQGTLQMIHGITLKDCIFFYSETASEIADPAMLEMENVQLKTWE